LFRVISIPGIVVIPANGIRIEFKEPVKRRLDVRSDFRLLPIVCLF
jgi:hypothetical protein